MDCKPLDFIKQTNEVRFKTKYLKLILEYRLTNFEVKKGINLHDSLKTNFLTRIIHGFSL